MEKIYKVVRKKENPDNPDIWCFVSAVIDTFMGYSDAEIMSLTYELGKTTVPKIGKIFAFREYRYAKRFAVCHSNSAILYCDAEGVSKSGNDNYVLNMGYSSIERIQDFWNNRIAPPFVSQDYWNNIMFADGYQIWEMILGTVLCDTVTPLTVLD